MPVFSIHKNEGYTVINNTVFKDKTLTWKAKGLLSTMLSLPDGWDYSINGLAALSKGGRDQVMSILDELEKAGYVVMTKTRNDRGQYITTYDVYEDPSRKIRLGKSDSEKTIEYNNKNKLLKNNTSCKEIQKEIPLDVEEVIIPEIIQNDRFEEFWNAYDKKVARELSMREWAKLSDKDRDAAIAYIPAYKAAQPDKQYRKNPSTYLHQHSWNDEIIQTKQPGQQQSMTGNPILDEALLADQMYQNIKF